MGRNIISVCHQCKVSLIHLRGQEGNWMQKFQREHQEHEHKTEIFSDYVKEAPDDYVDVFDEYYELTNKPTSKLSKETK